jgi:hypothetical protein
VIGPGAGGSGGLGWVVVVEVVGKVVGVVEPGGKRGASDWPPAVVAVEEGAVTAPRAAPPATSTMTSVAVAHGTTLLGIRCTFRPLRRLVYILSDGNLHHKVIE